MKIILFLIGILILLRVVRFITTPMLKKLGFYKYYSPMFFTMPFYDGSLDVHLGTSWDFLFCRKRSSKHILKLLAGGLYRLIEDIEKGNIAPDKIIRGNTYYLNSRTFESFGFSSRKMNLIERLLFFMNYPELCLLKSLSTRRISFIRLSNARILSIKAVDLIRYKAKIQRLENNLNNTGCINLYRLGTSVKLYPDQHKLAEAE